MRITFTITIIITILISGCQSKPQPEDIISVVSKLVAACAEDPTHDQNCLKIPLDADLNRQVSEVEIINEETAKVEFRYSGASTVPKSMN